MVKIAFWELSYIILIKCDGQYWTDYFIFLRGLFNAFELEIFSYALQFVQIK